VTEEGWTRVFKHITKGKDTVTARDIQKVSRSSTPGPALLSLKYRFTTFYSYHRSRVAPSAKVVDFPTAAATNVVAVDSGV